MGTFEQAEDEYLSDEIDQQEPYEPYEVDEDAAYERWRDEQGEAFEEMLVTYVNAGYITEKTFNLFTEQVQKQLRYYGDREDTKVAEDAASIAGFQLSIPEEKTLPMNTGRDAWRRLFALVEFILLG